MDLYNDEYFMKAALTEAAQAFDAGEIPVGAVVVWNKKIIGRGHNLTETLNDPTAHAEMQAITAATNTVGGKYLKDCVMYVTLEPCIMCAGACFWAQINTLVYGADDPKRGFSTLSSNILHPKTSIVSGLLGDECSHLLKLFFAQLREQSGR
ncbi:MAG: nucleoside deaminase [Prevotellaceae bacterium]|jgi:tRNA(adenine34) deaminase|nr:nucleoside deaminase [Prevotellaceae bacterium]